MIHLMISAQKNRSIYYYNCSFFAQEVTTHSLSKLVILISNSTIPLPEELLKVKAVTE